MKPSIVYWTGSGNTQIIAEAIQEAIEDLGITCESNYVSDITAEDVKDSDIFFLGCPSMSGEAVEEYEFRPFLDDILPYVSGKKVVLFGSYDWGDGEWMVSWNQEMVDAGSIVLDRYQIQWEPNEDQLASVKEKVKSYFKM